MCADIKEKYVYNLDYWKETQEVNPMIDKEDAILNQFCNLQIRVSHFLQQKGLVF